MEHDETAEPPQEQSQPADSIEPEDNTQPADNTEPYDQNLPHAWGHEIPAAWRQQRPQAPEQPPQPWSQPPGIPAHQAPPQPWSQPQPQGPAQARAQYQPPPQQALPQAQAWAQGQAHGQPAYLPVPYTAGHIMPYRQQQWTGLATAGLIIGITSVVFLFTGLLALAQIVLAITFSAIAMNRAKTAGTSSGQATAGLVLGILGAIGYLLFGIFTLGIGLVI
jgi:hypothetical protein